MARQNGGMPRRGPQISASGITKAQAIMPNSITQRFLTGSRKGPQNAIAMTMCAKASQSVP